MGGMHLEFSKLIQLDLSNSPSMASVQELVKEPLVTIPQQYVRVDQQTLSLNTTNFPPTPTIDMARLAYGDDDELKKLHSTCKEWGFFQLVNHGVSSSLLEKLKDEVEEFFKLPYEEKMKYKIKEGEVEGYGGRSREEGKYDWGDSLTIITNPLNMRKPHLFPELPSSLRNTLESYILELQKLAKKLLCLVAKALKIEMEEMMELFDDGMQAMRMAYYPPCPQPELVMGLTPHSDITLITILNQLNGVNGLEINKDGVWIPLDFKPDAFVVNVGDTLEVFSNGVYRSIEHKVTVNAEKERMTVAFFVHPKIEANVGPSPSLVNPNNPPLFKTLGMKEYFNGFVARKLNGKSYLECMKIQN